MDIAEVRIKYVFCSRCVKVRSKVDVEVLNLKLEGVS